MFWIIAGLVFVAFFFATCVCCGCDLFTENFDTAGTTISGWTEESGSWEVGASPTLLETSDADAVLVCGTALPTSSYTVKMGLNTLPVNDYARIYIRTDSSNYLVAEYRRQHHVKLFSCTGGVETLLSHVEQSGSFYTHMWLCCDLDSGVVSAAVAGTSGTGGISPDSTAAAGGWAVARTTPSGTELAVGTGPTITSAIKIGSVSVHRFSGTCSQCFVCCGSSSYPAEEIQVDVSGLGSTGAGTCADCSVLDGTYILTYQGRGGLGVDMPYGCLWMVEDSPGCSVDYIVLIEDAFHPSGSEHRLYFVDGVYGVSINAVKYFLVEGVGSDDNRICTGDESVGFVEKAHGFAELCRGSGMTATVTMTIL